MSSSSSSLDPAAALGDAWRHARQAFSFSSVRGREVTGTHHLRMDGYSTVDSVLEHGKCVDSKPFRAGGHRWKLSYYPHSHKDSTSGGPSIRLKLLENHFLGCGADASATYDVSVVDVDGNQLYHHATSQEIYSHRGTSGIWIDVGEGKAEVAEREEALRRLKDDSLVVRCDVTVKRLQEESRIRWLLRRFLD